MKIKWLSKNNLDEMQEQKLLHIESSSFWILYAMLLVAILIQCVFFKPGACEILPELICFLAISFIILIRCAKNGIWDRRFQPNVRTNIAASILAGVVVAALQPITYLFKPEQWYSLTGMFITMAIVGPLTFCITFFLMSISSYATKKQSRKLEQEEEE